MPWGPFGLKFDCRNLSVDEYLDVFLMNHDKMGQKIRLVPKETFFKPNFGTSLIFWSFSS